MLSEINDLIEKKSYWIAVEKIIVIFKKHPSLLEKLFGLELSQKLSSEEQDLYQEFKKIIDKGYNEIIEFAIDTMYNVVRDDSKYDQFVKKFRNKLADYQREKEITLNENEWTDLQLRHRTKEYPACDLSISFDEENLIIKSEVRDLHFKDGNRSWRYGDGFIINFILPRQEELEDCVDSNRFYGLGFSVISGKPLGQLINHSGKYYLRNHEFLNPKIDIFESEKKANYLIKIPWSFLEPFRPLLDGTGGLNIIYTSQNDDQSKTLLQYIPEGHYDSEMTKYRRFAPLHLKQSKNSKIQLTGELENRLLAERKFKIKYVIYSDKEIAKDLTIKISNSKEEAVIEAVKSLQLKKGKNIIEDTISLPSKTSGLLNLIFKLEGAKDWNETCFIYDKDLLSTYEKQLENLEGEDILILNNSIYSIRYRINHLNQLINEFENRDNPKTIAEKFEELPILIKEIEEKKSIFIKGGYLLASFLSPTDNELQPYSIYLPDDFDPKEKYNLMMVFHGSGVDELFPVKMAGEGFGDKGFIIFGPRGRGLSDEYKGQSEIDSVDILKIMQEMFQIDETYAFGFSMGGYGAWRLTFKYPEYFDKAIIIAGYAFKKDRNIPEDDMRNFIGKSKDIDYFVMHGTDDHAVAIGPTDEFIEVLIKECYNVEYIRVEGGGHGNFSFDKELVSWLMKF